MYGNVQATTFVTYIYIYIYIYIYMNIYIYSAIYIYIAEERPLCRTKILPVTHLLVDTWILTVKPVYKL